MSAQNQKLEKAVRVEQEVLDVTEDPILERMLAEERVESRWLDSTLLGRLFVYLRPHRALALGAVSLAVVEALMMTLPAYIIGLAIDRVGRSHQGVRESAGLAGVLDWLGEGFVAMVGPMSQGGAAGTLILFFGLLVLLLWVGKWMIAVTTTYTMQKLGQLVVHDLRVDVYRHITELDMNFFHHNPVGRLVNRTTFDVQSVAELFSDAFAMALRDLLFVLVLVLVMLSLDLPLAAVLIFSFPWLVGVGLLYRRYARPALRTNSAVRSRMNAWLAENLAGMRENHLYRLQPWRAVEYRALTEAHQSSITHVIRAWGMLRPGMMLVSAVSTTVVLLLGYERVVEGVVSVGVLLTFLQYTVQLWRPVRNLTEKFNLIQTALTAGERIIDVLEARAKVFDLQESDPSLTVEEGRIAFEQVRFAYPAKPTLEVLKGLDFEVAPGQTLALVGDTGAGKSTIAHLLSRFYDVTQGRVCVDGRDVREFKLRRLRQGIAIVPQDVTIFAGTLRENITLGTQVPDELIWRCIKAVRAEIIVDRFEKGLDHVMEEGGRTLSTGERQLISFARALVFNPPVLILDEATANVDTQTELLIQEALGALTKGRTSVIIAHRLSTIRDADLILVLRHGQVVERGDHASLMSLDGEYARLVHLHMRAEDEAL